MKKRFFLLAIVFLLLALPAAYLNLQQGIWWGDTFLRRTADGYGSIRMTRSDAGTLFSGTLDNFTWHGTVTREGKSIAVTFPDGTRIAGTWNGEYLCDPSGMPHAFQGDMVTIVVNGEAQPPSPIAQADLMCRMALEQIEQRGSLLLVLLGLFVYVTGALSILYPEKMALLGGRWRFAYAELSDAGRAAQKFSGWVCILLSPIVMYLPLFSFLLN